MSALSPEDFDLRSQGFLPGLLGMKMRVSDPARLVSELAVRKELFAPNGYLHAASIIALADTTCGYGAMLNLPREASGFTTLELKSNFTGTAHDGIIECTAKPLHLGRNTQLWDAQISAQADGRTIAHFRCTQMVLWPR